MEKRPRNAHRRYTRAESQAIDHVRRELDGGGLDTLIQFANHDARPWNTLWRGISTWQIHGEPFTEEEGNELQQSVRADLRRAVRGEWSTGSYGIIATMTYWVSNNSVTVEGPQDNLDEYLTWLLVESIRSGKIRHLKHCR
jgi:hypothetical protein